jgi:hypothetical protein
VWLQMEDAVLTQQKHNCWDEDNFPLRVDNLLLHNKCQQLKNRCCATT